MSIPPNPGLAVFFGLGVFLALGVGDDGSLSLIVETRPRGVQASGVSAMGVDARANLDGVVVCVAIFVGDGLGVDCRRGDGEAGLSGLRNGDARGEP